MTCRHDFVTLFRCKILVARKRNKQYCHFEAQNVVGCVMELAQKMNSICNRATEIVNEEVVFV